jgi:hypothetical protein
MLDNNTLICYNIWPLFADHILDYSKEYYKHYGVERLHNKDNFIPENVKEGEIVFVKSDFIADGTFYQHFFPGIKNKFKLITGNSSYQLGNHTPLDQLKSILDSPKLITWFCTNPPDLKHEKIVSLPIGFEEMSRAGGNQLLLNNARKRQRYFWHKEDKVFLPYHGSTNPQRASQVNFLSSFEFVKAQHEKQDILDYLNDIDKYKFVICLGGAGNDLHRIYETYLMGSIPIVQKSSLEKLFSFYDLPVVMVDRWENFDKLLIATYRAYSPGDVLVKKLENVGRFLMACNYKNLFETGNF